MSEEQGYKDLSGETRDVEELVPDRWFYADKLKGQRLTLRVAKVFGDEAGLEMVMTFEGDERWLSVPRDMRLILKDRFGAAPAGWIGKDITITALPNWKQRYFIKLLPEELDEPKTIAIESSPPQPKPKGKGVK